MGNPGTETGAVTGASGTNKDTDSRGRERVREGGGEVQRREVFTNRHTNGLLTWPKHMFKLKTNARVFMSFTTEAALRNEFTVAVKLCV